MGSLHFKAICLWVKNEDQYLELIDDTKRLRAHLNEVWSRFPELFPHSFGQGFHFHDRRTSKKLGLELRRIKLVATGQVYLLRPCFVMPYCCARVQELEQAFYLRLSGVSFDSLSYCFGRSAKFYERAFVALARTNLVATTFKGQLPEHLVADEKHVTTSHPTSFLCVTAALGCILGAELVAQADEEHFKQGYGVMVEQAKQAQPNWSPQSICLDGFRATQAAWRALLPRATIVLCFLHAMLKLRQISPKKTREEKTYQELLDRGWKVFQGPTRRHFAQRLRRLEQWGMKHLERGKLKSELRKMLSNSKRYSVSYNKPGCYRTSNMVDRLMAHQSHLLRAQRGFHGSEANASAMMRAHALLWNFHPYGARLKREQSHRRSPFHDVNGFEYHAHWLSNLLLAASLDGLGRASHQIRRS